MKVIEAYRRLGELIEQGHSLDEIKCSDDSDPDEVSNTPTTIVVQYLSHGFEPMLFDDATDANRASAGEDCMGSTQVVVIR